jgi:hypothetical protein
MRTTASIAVTVLLLTACPLRGAAQEKLELSGSASAGYSASSDAVDSASGVDPSSGVHELDLGLDLHAGTFVLSPKFITIAADLRLSTLKGQVGDTENSSGVQGQTYVVNVLPNSAYPFRLLYSREDSGYSQRQTSIFSSASREFRWDWRLRVRSLPQVTVTYDSRSNRSGAFTNPNQLSSTKGLSLGVQDSFSGWDVRGAYDRRSSNYAVTNLDTSLTTANVDVYKTFDRNSRLTSHLSRQNMVFEPTAAFAGERFAFLDVRTEYTRNIGKKLSLQLYDQNYASRVARQSPTPATSATGLFAPVPHARDLSADATASPLEPELNFGPPAASVAASAAVGSPLLVASGSGWTGLFAPTAEVAVAPAPTDLPDAPPAEIRTRSTTFGGQLSYTLLPAVTVGAGGSISYITPPDESIETATSLYDAQASVAWGQRVKFVSARANAVYGIDSAKSNLGNRARGPFYTLGAGLSVGSPRLALVYVDGNYVHREDVFFANGFSSETDLTAGVETQILPSLRITGTAGLSTFRDLNPEGRGDFRRTNVALGVEQKYATFQVSRNVNVGDRDIFSTPFAVDANRLFFQLPIETLIPDPLQRTRSIFTQAVLRLRLVRDLDLEARYSRNLADFVDAQDSIGTEYQLLAGYRVGKFTFRAGGLRQRLALEDAPSRERTQYFFRVSRAFRIF